MGAASSTSKRLERAEKTGVLALREQGASSLPDRVWTLRSLRSLDVGHNRLLSLPQGVGKLSSLTSLAVEGNRLKALPPALGQLTKLENLTASHNLLTALPDALAALARLKKLAVSHNSIEVMRRWLPCSNFYALHRPTITTFLFPHRRLPPPPPSSIASPVLLPVPRSRSPRPPLWLPICPASLPLAPRLAAPPSFAWLVLFSHLPRCLAQRHLPPPSLLRPAECARPGRPELQPAELSPRPRAGRTQANQGEHPKASITTCIILLPLPARVGPHPASRNAPPPSSAEPALLPSELSTRPPTYPSSVSQLAPSFLPVSPSARLPCLFTLPPSSPSSDSRPARQHSHP